MQGPVNFMNPDKKKDEFPLLTAFACAACVVIFVMINSVDRSQVVLRSEQLGGFSSEQIWSGKWWGLLTSVFVHIEIWHVAFNVYWLWILGGAVERQKGSMWFAAFFIAAAWISSGIQLLTGGAGIGMSGVGYALFGLVWTARHRILPFQRVINERTAGMFLIWFVMCFALNASGSVRIGNGAHAGGLAFGACVGWWLARQEKRPLTAAGIAALAVLSIVPLFGVPWSGEWVASRAINAMKAKDYAGAEKWLLQSIDKGEDRAWALHNLAQIYGFQDRPREYADALAKLRALDPQRADDVESRYGKPGEAISSPKP